MIRFVEMFDQVEFNEAVRKLTVNSEKLKVKTTATEETGPPSRHESPNARQYLERVVAIYENNFIQKDKGKQFLNGRGITDAGLFTKHTVGFCDGTLDDILPGNGDIRESLKQIGILLDNEGMGSKEWGHTLICD